MSESILKLGIPAGSLQKATFDLFNRAGFRLTESSRSYWPLIDDPQIKPVCLRAQEMARYVCDGVLDAGITGYDWIMENACDVIEVCELAYSKSTSNPTRWVLAVPEGSKVHRAEDLAGGLVAKKYFADKGVDVRVEFSWGATEVKAHLVDGIVELTETGASLRANGLRIVDTVVTSTTRFITNPSSWADPFKREKIENLTILLRAAIEGQSKVGLKMNVKKVDLDAVLGVVPAEKSPTISSLADALYVAIEVVVDERVERALIPALKRAGASGIITYSLNKVIH
jgi:ATP phosphoribosyltransferase